MVVVTGASGLLGGEILRQLAAAGVECRGVDLRADDSSSAPVMSGDLLDPDLCRRACKGATAVIHAAARQHHSNPPRWGRRRFFSANIQMTHNLMEGARSAGVRQLVFVSSDMVYGMPRGRPFSEKDMPRPIGPYGWSKLQSERICAGARNRYLSVVILRPRLIVGPGRLGILRRLFDRVRKSRIVPMLGSGRNRYQMVAVSDVAVACIRAIAQPMDGIFNLGSADPPPVRQLLKGLCRRAGSRSWVVGLPLRPSSAALWMLHGARLAPLNPEQFRIASVDYVLDTGRAREALGWEPRLSDADMLWSAYETYVTGLQGAVRNAAQWNGGASATPI